jgi:hypothetical protein
VRLATSQGFCIGNYVYVNDLHAGFLRSVPLKYRPPSGDGWAAYHALYIGTHILYIYIYIYNVGPMMTECATLFDGTTY